jgi:hypothetical protein
LRRKWAVSAGSRWAARLAKETYPVAIYTRRAQRGAKYGRGKAATEQRAAACTGARLAELFP